MQPRVSVGGGAGPVAVGTGQQYLGSAAKPQQPQQHEHAVAALGIGAAQTVVVHHGGRSAGPQVAGQHQRAGVGGFLVKALGVGEKRIVRRHKVRHKVGGNRHVSSSRLHGSTARLGGQGGTGGQHQHLLAAKGRLQGRQGGLVVDTAVAVLGVELVGVGGVKHRLFARVDGRQDVVDVPHGEIALVQQVLGVVAVEVEPGRQEVGRGIAPCALPLDGGDMVLDGVHDLVQVVVAVAGLVAVVRHQFDGQIAGGTAHAHEAGVHGLVPQQRFVHEFLGQTEAQSHVLMEMQAQTDVRGQVVVGQRDDPLQVPAAHAAEGVHDGELPGMDGVDLVEDPQQVLVAVAHDVDGVDGQLVPPGFHLPGKVHAVPDVVVVGGDADQFDAVAVVGAQLGNIVVGAHGHAGVDRVAPLALVGQQPVELLDGVADRHVGVVALHIAQKAHLHQVGAGPGQGLDDPPRRTEAPAPVVDVAAVTQGAVQQFDIRHGVSPSESR